MKTSYIDMSSRFTAPHCLCYYQVINSRARMNWLTLRVTSVASCNVIPYIICPSCSLFLSNTRVGKLMFHVPKFQIKNNWKADLVGVICHPHPTATVRHRQLALSQMQLWCSGGSALFLILHHCS